MILVERIRSKKGDIAKFDLQISDVSELPVINNVLDGFADLKVGAGSIAQVIQTGAWYTLNENGTWYDSDGNAAGSDSVSNLNLNASPDLNIKRESIDETTPEQIEREPILGGGKSILSHEPEYVEQPETETDDLEESEVPEDAE